MSFKELLRFFFLPVYRPLKGIHLLLDNKKKIPYALLIFLFLGVIYTISVQLAYMRGLGAAVEPFLKIPAEDYYFWQRFYQIPFFFITSIIFAGIARLMSISAKGKGNFEDMFCIFCVAQTFPMFITMWLPETISFIFFPGQKIFPLWIDIFRQVLGILWPLVIMVAGITISEKIKWYYAALITLVAAMPITALMVIFIR